VTLTFRYINTTGTHTFNVDLGTSVVRLGSIDSGLVSSAALGQAGTGGVDLDDPDGSLDILALQYLRVTESACPAGSDILWYGYIGDRTVRRGGSARPSLRTGAARTWGLQLTDFNSILALRRINSGSRPAEGADVRLAWLLALSNCPVHDNGYVTYATHAMDANDYTDQTFQDALNDIIAQTAYDFWADYDQTAGNIGLWLLDPGGSSWSTTAQLSDILSDIDQTTTRSSCGPARGWRPRRRSGTTAAGCGSRAAPRPTATPSWTRWPRWAT
jgi:hypothetical protein